MAKRTCSIEKCGHAARSRGWCAMHYMRWWSAQPRGECSVEGCGRNIYSGGLCQMHYVRKRTTGEAGEAAPRFMQKSSVAERFWVKVDRCGPVPDARPDLGPCWLWTKARFVSGYGLFGVGGKTVSAHRVAYELEIGSIPAGLHLDHLCRVRHCVNPAHLEPVTLAENVRRGSAPSTVAARRGTCKRGHDLTDPANLKPNSRGARQCRQCSNIARRERYQRLGR